MEACRRALRCACVNPEAHALANGFYERPPTRRHSDQGAAGACFRRDRWARGEAIRNETSGAALSNWRT